MMIHEIAPEVLDNQYRPAAPEPEEYVLFVEEAEVLARITEDTLDYDRVKDLPADTADLTYLFDISGRKFFLAGRKPGREAAYDALLEERKEKGLARIRRREILRFAPRHLAYAGALAAQIGAWYENNRFCGRCGTRTVHSDKERMLHCPKCGNIIYPRISPVIITAILDGDRVVVSHYAAGPYRHYALIAGYNEVGESIEETLRREVMEEVGLEVENIRYYKCQPWPVTDTLLFGFFCDVKGSRTLKVDKSELSDAIWLTREEAKAQLTEDNISLTREMLMVFSRGEEPK